MFMGGGNILKGGDDNESSSSSLDSADPVDSMVANDYNTTINFLDTADDGSSSLDEEGSTDVAPLHKQIFGVTLLIASLFFDGGTGAYEDKMMSVYSVEPFDLMFKFNVGKGILAALIIVIFNQVDLFVDMIRQTGICKFFFGS
jgi:hypothetical protein